LIAAIGRIHFFMSNQLKTGSIFHFVF
jgi:hypothetical protein